MKKFFCGIYALGRAKSFAFLGAFIILALFLFGMRTDALLFALSLTLTFAVVGALKLISRTPRPKHALVET